MTTHQGWYPCRILDLCALRLGLDLSKSLPSGFERVKSIYIGKRQAELVAFVSASEYRHRGDADSKYRNVKHCFSDKWL